MENEMDYTDDPYRVASPYCAPGEVEPDDVEFDAEAEAQAEDDAIRSVLACRLATSIHSVDGRDIVIESIAEADADFQRAIAYECSTDDKDADDAALGRMIRKHVRAYALSCAKAKGMVDA